ncbi:carboxypeptidase regulatory-like domain-containing protein [Piscinibacter sp.]|jgi:hypothetical protein|uniref:carboxypeptidase regulatory-like domain-containing protein n=1 Tax=Piscinibacter sp. TaxID=1903157 RepID=UPI002F3FA06B
MKKQSITVSCAAAALMMGSVAAFAAGLPAERQAGGVSYVTGGVSEEEATLFKQARTDYPLSIELVQKAGAHNAFTADARVKVTDSAGNVVLDAKADGPFMLVRLPAGNYHVQATLNGRTVGAKPVTVGAKGSAQTMLVFPQDTN